jgi:hypothetical protein
MEIKSVPRYDFFLHGEPQITIHSPTNEELHGMIAKLKGLLEQIKDK